MATHVVRQFLQTAAEQVPAAAADGDLTLTGSLQQRLAETITGGSTDLLINVAVDQSELNSLFLFCDRALTIKTNSNSAPDDTISLRAGEPLHWHTNSYFTCPLSADVTKIYVTLAAGDDAVLYWDDLQDATP